MFFFFSLAGAQNFDVIRLSTYRTACKLRFVQKRCNRKSIKILISFQLLCNRVTNRNACSNVHTDVNWSQSVPSSHSSSGGCLEHDRSLSWQWAQHAGPQRWDQCVAVGDYPVFHLLPAQQAAAHHPSDQCGAVHRAAAQLHGGHLRQVWVQVIVAVTIVWGSAAAEAMPEGDRWHVFSLRHNFSYFVSHKNKAVILYVSF